MTNSGIVVVDYQAGNPVSIINMLKKIGFDSVLTNNIHEIEKAKKIIIPGVGTFDYGVKKLKELNLLDILEKKAQVEKVPFLGICLGFQLMTVESEEGIEKGLGWFNAKTKKFKFETSNFKIPHMGWNNVKYSAESPIFKGFAVNPRFYFVHSFFVQPYENSHTIGETLYGSYFTSAMQAGNIYGVQFHPEKSHKFGMHMLQNFVGL